MANNVSLAVLEELGITSKELKRAEEKIRSRRTRVYCFIGTSEQAREIASNANIGVASTSWMARHRRNGLASIAKGQVRGW